LLVAAILGHSRCAEGFDLLKELAEKGQGPPALEDLHASSVYSIGLIRSPQSAPYLSKLFSETPDARKNFGEKFGTPLMAAVGMCGKEGVALLKEAALTEISPDLRPDTDEGLRPYRWSYLSLVDSPEAFADLKTIASQDPDIRLRGMAITAMGQSSDPEQRAYLAELYARDDAPEIRRAILESLNDGASSSPADWAAMRDRMAGPLASILKSTRLPSGNEYVDYATIYLASAAGTPEAKKYVDDWLRTAASGAYDAESFWIDIAIHALASQGASPERVDALLQAGGVTPSDRLYYLASFQNEVAAPVGGLAWAREFMAALDKSPGSAFDGHFLNCLGALGRIPEARDEIEGCIERLIQRAEGPDRLRFIHAVQSAGEVSLRPLEKVIRNSSDLSEMLGATQGYLLTLPESGVLDPALGDRMKSLFSSRALGAFSAGALGARYGSTTVFARTVGLYFSRFGTPQDLAWLESLPRTLNDPRNVREDQLKAFRDVLASECARAADAIKLRSK